MKTTPSLTCLLAFIGISAGLNTASAAPFVVTDVETVNGQTRFGSGLGGFAAADLTALGTTDWAIFGVNGLNGITVNRDATGTAISDPSTNITTSDPGAGVAPGGEQSYQRTNWSYTNGTTPTSAVGDNSGGLGVEHYNSINQEIDLTFDLTGANSGTFDIWYSVFQGEAVLTASLGSDTATDSLGQGYDNVGLRHVSIDFTKTNPLDNTLFLSLGMDARFSFNPQVTIYGATLSLDAPVIVTTPEPSTYALLGLGMGVVFFLRRKQIRNA